VDTPLLFDGFDSALHHIENPERFICEISNTKYLL